MIEHLTYIVQGQDNSTIIKKLYHNKYGRDMTDFETTCFNMLDKEQQITLIKRLN